MRRFEFSDSTSNKFWEVDVKGKTLNVTFGKIGTKGQSKPKDFAAPEKAKAEMEKLIKEKTGKGYVEVGGKVSKKTSPATGKNTNTELSGDELSKVARKAKAEKVIAMLANGQWEIGKGILESNHGEVWLYEELLKGAKIEKGSLKPSTLINKYFKNLRDDFGNSRDNGEMVMLGVLLETPTAVKKSLNLDIKKVSRVMCIPYQSNLEYFAHICESFPWIKEWQISPDNDFFEIKTLSDSAAKLISKWGDMEVVGFNNLSNLSDKAISYLCQPCPEYFDLPKLKTLSGDAAKSFVDMLKRGATGVSLGGLENITEDAVKIIIKSKFEYSSDDSVEGFFIPKKIRKIIDGY